MVKRNTATKVKAVKKDTIGPAPARSKAVVKKVTPEATSTKSTPKKPKAPVPVGKYEVDFSGTRLGTSCRTLKRHSGETCNLEKLVKEADKLYGRTNLKEATEAFGRTLKVSQFFGLVSIDGENVTISKKVA